MKLLFILFVLVPSTVFGVRSEEKTIKELQRGSVSWGEWSETPEPSELVWGSWGEEKTAREIAFLYALSMDWRQTIKISRSRHFIEAQNSILGKNPSEESIHLFFVAFAAFHMITTYLIPDDNIAKVFQQAYIIGQCRQAEKNNDIGLNKRIGMRYKINYTIEF